MQIVDTFELGKEPRVDHAERQMSFYLEDGELISGALGETSAAMLPRHGLLIAAPTIDDACAKALAFERPARMHLIAAIAGKVQPIDSELGKEATDRMFKPKRNTAAFNYYARRALGNPHNRDCMALSAVPVAVAGR